MRVALVAAVAAAPGVTSMTRAWVAPMTEDLVPAGDALNPPPPPAPPSARAPATARAQPLSRTLAPASLAPPRAGGRFVYASWYGPGFYGRRTACGQIFSARSWGIAHRSLPCGTVVGITYGGRTVSVPVIDRGPFIAGREVDLGEAVAKSLGFAGVRLVYLAVP
jgi:rare lipoprotein A (peptidoglycan hydrolase)